MCNGGESENHLVVSTSLRPHGLYNPWILPARILEWVSFPFSRGSFQPRSNPGLPYCRQILYQLSHQGSPGTLEWVAYPFSSGSSQPRNQTRVSCIAGGLFTKLSYEVCMICTYHMYMIHMYISLNDFAGHLKLTQHCKPTINHLKKD